MVEKKLADDNRVELIIDETEDELSGLSMKQVSEAHMAWIDQLKSVLDGHANAQLDIQTVAKDNMCVLGKWLYGPAKKLYGTLPEYNTLKLSHVRFHTCAGQVLQDYQDCHHQIARARLKKELRTLSGQIQLDLVSLYARARNLK